MKAHAERPRLNEIAGETVRIPGPFGDLEGLLEYPLDRKPRGAALLLSPHPRLGGDLHNNVLNALAHCLPAAGWATLRFNYHGVGASDSPAQNSLRRLQYWLELPNDRALEVVNRDAIAAYDWLAPLASPRVVVGYSLGALAALGLSSRDDTAATALIAPPVGECAAMSRLGAEKPVLLIHGDSDFASSVDETAHFATRFKSGARTRCVDGADHFFRGYETRVATIVMAFLDEVVKGNKPR